MRFGIFLLCVFLCSPLWATNFGQRVQVQRVFVPQQRVQVQRVFVPQQRVQVQRVFVPQQRVQVQRVFVPQQRVQVQRVQVQRVQRVVVPSVAGSVLRSIFAPRVFIRGF